jgi:hypothetical protein
VVLRTSSHNGSWEFNVTYVDIGELDSPIRLIFDELLVLECRELNIESLGKLSRMVRPHISERIMKINMYGQKQIPSASDWCEWFDREGLSICFRRLGDVATAPNEVSDDYGGWFIQLPDRIGSTVYGLMCRSLVCRSDGSAVTFEHWKEREIEIDIFPRTFWNVLAKIAASMPTSIIETGNCNLSTQEFSNALEQGQEYLDSLYAVAQRSGNMP